MPLLPSPERKRSTRVLWPMRAVVLVGAFVLCVYVVYPGLGDPIAGLLVSAVLAAAAISLEVLLTARVREQSLRDIVIWRLVMLDKLMSKPGESMADQQSPSAFEAPAQQPERPRLHAGMSSGSTDEDVIDVEAHDIEDPDSEAGAYEFEDLGPDDEPPYLS